MRRSPLLLATLAGLLPCAAQRAPLRGAGASSTCAVPAPAPPALTREQGAQILEELVAIQDELRDLDARGVGARGGARALPATARLPLGKEPIALGSSRAPVTIVEFDDLQCPFCRAFATTTLPKIERDYIATGEVRFISRDMPLPIHPYAMGAAEAEQCAGAQGKFWQFRAGVLGAQGPPTPSALTAEAARLDLDMSAFQRCLSTQRFAKRINGDIAAARAAGARGTPTFIIGEVPPGAPGGAVILTGTVLRGNRPYADFQAAIKAALRRAGRHP